jgi:hypothetical protein
MQSGEIRHIQWEIADSIYSSLKDGKVLVGQIGDIIQLCDLHSKGTTVAKFLQRAETMPHMPFQIRRSFKGESSHHGRMYRIKLKIK